MIAFHLHLVSDSTGETIRSVARACLVQFEEVTPTEHMWPMARTARAIEQVIEDIAQHPGPVIFTIVDAALRTQLLEACHRLKVPGIPVLDPVILAVGSYLGAQASGRPGRQHEMNAAYFRRIEAMDWSMEHDDGQALSDLNQADVVLVGVSRTSKTPTSLYLGNQGMKAANVPFVPGFDLPPELDTIEDTLIIGLNKDARRLVETRRTRLLALHQDPSTAYVDLESVGAEVAEARRHFSRRGWPVIDVSRRSIEETAAEIMRMLLRRREQESDALVAEGSTDD